jgi:hypothetical protein
MDANKTTTNWIIAGLVALVVIIGGGWLIARERSGSMAGTQTASTTASVETATVSKDSTGTSKTNTKASQAASAAAAAPDMTASASGETVSVSDQAAGSKVMVADVSVVRPTWVAVRDTRKWYPGAVLVSGNKTNVEIPLLRPTVAGETYEVVLFVDNGDGKFSIHNGDMLVAGTAGAPVSSTFKAK